MKLLNFTIIKITQCFVAGIIIGYYFKTSLEFNLAAISILFLFLLIAFIKAKKTFIKNIWFGVISLLIIFFIGIFVTHIHNEKNNSLHYTKQLNNDKDSLSNISFRIREVLKPGNYYEKYVIEIFELDSKHVIGKSLLNIQKDSIGSQIKVDDIYILKTNFKELIPPLNPHQFNYKNYLEKKYIYHQIFTTNTSLYKVNTNKTTLFGAAENIRRFINTKLKNYNFQPDELAIINALLLGQRQDISEEIYTSYTNAGAIHILAISGLHIGIILLILQFVFKPIEKLKYGRLLKSILLIVILWSFAIIAGLSASVTRAVTMFSIVAIALNLKRPTNIYNTLAISMLIILMFKPMFLFDVGFQLSYLAVFSIVSIDPHLFKLWQPKNKFVKFYWHTLTITISAQFGIIPLSLYYFHQFPSLFFLSNLIIIPFLGVILGFGIAVIFLASINFLPNILANVYGYIISLMNGFVSWISHQEAFLFKDIPFNLICVFALYILFITLIQLFIKRNNSTLKYFLLSVLFVQFTVIYNSLIKPKNEFIVFHKSRYTLLGRTSQYNMRVTSDIDSLTKKNDKIIRDYIVGNNIKSIKSDSFQAVYLLENKSLLVVDSLAVYNVKSFNPDYVLLRQSPKLNLNRLIDSINPKQIIADGSNYKSYIENWESICLKRKLPFYATSKNGAFIIKY